MAIDSLADLGIKWLSMEHQFTEAILIQDLRREVSGSNQKEVAKRLRLTPQYINDVLHSRRPISAKMAKRLGYKRVVVFERTR